MKRGICFCGCGKKTRVPQYNDRWRGVFKGIPFRFLKGHNRKWNESSYYINKKGCYVWKGSKSSSGYGNLTVNLKTILAHRYCYEKAKGLIPKNLTLDHLCRNRACVNPNHLEPVTMRINILRGVGITAQNFKKTICKWGHLLIGKNVYFLKKYKERRCKTCVNKRARELYRRR